MSHWENDGHERKQSDDKGNVSNFEIYL